MSSILVTLTSRSSSNFERSNISLEENKPDGVDPNSNGLDCRVQKNEGKNLRFLADCIVIITKTDSISLSGRHGLSGTH